MIFNMIGGGDIITLETLNVNDNGIYTPVTDTAYNQVNVDVPITAVVSGTQHTYRLAPNSTISKGDLCCYGSIGQAGSFYYVVFPYGYNRGSATSAVIPCVALETKTAGASGTVNIDVIGNV